jgi:hypothetical protein
MYPPPYSEESAISIVIEVGNIGEKLSLEKWARKITFFSRDRGVTFSEIAKIPLIYEFGDHGWRITSCCSKYLIYYIN